MILVPVARLYRLLILYMKVYGTFNLMLTGDIGQSYL
jgi:hypothetical protein